MVDTSMLKPGYVVKIVDEWNEYTRENPDGEMDEWLGKLMTIQSRRGSSTTWFKMMEDDGAWSWNEHTIDYIVAGDEREDFQSESDEALNDFLGGF